MADYYRHRLLRSLAADALALLAPSFRPVQLVRGETIIRLDDRIDHLIFPERGLVCARTPLADGNEVTLFTIGLDGVVGGHTMTAGPESAYDYYVRISGHGLALPRATLQNAMAENPEFRARIQGFCTALLKAVVQVAACSYAHPAERRVPRVLLCIADALHADRLPLTRKDLAEILGLNRIHVSQICHDLADRGAIGLLHGGIVIQDRAQLLERACECYLRMRTVMDGFS